MLAYLAILGSAVAGFADAKPWAIAVAATVLASISFVQHSDLYDRGRAMGLVALLDLTLFKSIANALIASGVAYGFGWLLHLL